MRDLEVEYNPNTSDILRRILQPGHGVKNEIEIEMLRIFESLPASDQINLNGTWHSWSATWKGWAGWAPGRSCARARRSGERKEDEVIERT